MKINKLMNKISKVVEKHATDTGFSENYDAVGEYFAVVLNNLTVLQNYSTRPNLSWKELGKMQRTTDSLVETLKAGAADERISRKYSSLIKDIENAVNELYETIKQMNFAHSTLEEAISNGFLKEMRGIKTQEEKDFNYLKSAATSGQTTFTAQHVEGDQYMLANRMKEADSLLKEISGLPLSEENLKSLQKQAEKINKNITVNVINHYDTLQALDKELNHNDQLIKNINLEELKAQKADILEDDTIENE